MSEKAEMTVKLHAWASRYAEGFSLRAKTPEQVELEAAIGDAFRAGWRASRTYAARQAAMEDGPG